MFQSCVRRFASILLSGTLAVLLTLGLTGWSAHAADAPTIKVGVLKFGTVNWELKALKHAGLDADNGFNLEVIGFASGDASEIALQGGEVDIIVSDWL